MCGCRSAGASSAGAPAFKAAMSGEVLTWMHKAGMVDADKIVSYGPTSGMAIFFTQDRIVPVLVVDFAAHKAVVEAAGGQLFSSDKFTLVRSPMTISGYLAPSGIVYTIPAGAVRAVIPTDIPAIEADNGVVLSGA